MLMTKKSVMDATQISETCLRRMEKAGRFPRSRLINRRRYWRTEDVQNWVDEQMNDRGVSNAEKSNSWLTRWA
jgi:predicted DNA-binding transcriptional regulator AlpA